MRSRGRSKAPGRLGTSADLEVLVVGCNDENIAEATGAELFHVTAERVQNLTQWFASRHPLEHLHFGRKQILRPFQIVDINLERYIADDVALRVTDGDASRARPPIGAVRIEHAKLLVHHLAGRSGEP